MPALLPFYMPPDCQGVHLLVIQGLKGRINSIICPALYAPRGKIGPSRSKMPTVLCIFGEKSILKKTMDIEKRIVGGEKKLPHETRKRLAALLGISTVLMMSSCASNPKPEPEIPEPLGGDVMAPAPEIPDSLETTALPSKDSTDVKKVPLDTILDWLNDPRATAGILEEPHPEINDILEYLNSSACNHSLDTQEAERYLIHALSDLRDSTHAVEFLDTLKQICH